MTTDNQILSGINPEDPEELEDNVVIIEDPEDGSVEIEFIDEEDDLEEFNDMEAKGGLLDTTDHFENLAIFLLKEDLDELASDVIDRWETDESSRHGHMEELRKGLKNLGLGDADVDTPFDGACEVFHPLIMENAVKIQAKAEGELLPPSGPVKTQIIGKSDEESELRASNIKRHMNWQLTEQMREFYTNTERALLQAPLFGDAFKKNWFDPVKGRPCDAVISIDKFVVNNCCTDLHSADVITEIQDISEREMKARMYSGLYRDDVDVGEPYEIEKSELGTAIDDLLGFDKMGEGYTVIEQHCYLDLPEFEDESGVPLPYIVTVETQSKEVLAIRKNWAEFGSKFEKQEYFTQYPFVRGFGFYNLGYIHLLGNYQMTLTAIMRSLVDSGSFANMQGGFKAKQLRVLDDGDGISPGEFKDVEFYGQDISKAIYPLNFKEPSGTLLTMLQLIEDRGQKFADSAEQALADSTNYGPVGTTMALLDASAKFFSAIFKKFHAAQKDQLRIIARLNFENLMDDPEGITFNIPGQELRISKEDYDGRIDIIPVSDPNISSRAHRITLASQKLQSALQAPDIHDRKEAYKQYYIAMGEENYEKLLPPSDTPQRLEPLEDLMAVVEGKPIKAFPDQDHDAHIAVKNAFINDPASMQNPSIQMVLPQIQANIREHTVMKFAAQIEGAQQAGINQQQAAQEIIEFNKFKAENPLGALDPKQLLAQAEVFKQQNEAKRLDVMKANNEMDTAVDIAELQLELRNQNLDLMKAKMKLNSDKERAEFDAALKVIQESLKSSQKIQ
jgi:hypothetical protein